MSDSLFFRPAHGGNLAWAASLASCSPDLILDFSASINPLGPPQSAIAAIQSHLRHLRDYPDPDYRELCHALSQFHAVPANWILPGNGSAELLTWVSRDLSTLEATVLPTPAFGDYGRALNAFDAQILPYPLQWARQGVGGGERQDNGADEDYDSLFTPHASSPEFNLPSLSPQTCGLLLNNPHNPTGTLFSAKTLLPYLEQFALVVVDEAFMDFLLPEHQESLVEWVANYPNLVILRSLTKFYSLPGLRMGYAIAHPDRLKRWRQWRDPWSVNTLAAAAGVAVLQDISFQQQTWNWLASAKPALLTGLRSLPGLHPYPGAANFLLVQSDTSVMKLQHDLLQQSQILIRDCMSFPELGDRYFRIAVRTDAENQRLLEGLQQVLG